MNVSFTEEQEELRRYVRQWLDERAPIDHVREVMESDAGFDADQWKELGELGWLGMAVPERYGGAGYGFLELAVVAEEMGRTLYPSPFLSSVVLAAGVIEQADEDARAELLSDIATGARRASLALVEENGDWSASSFSTTARSDGDGWIVEGSKEYVIDGHTSDTLIVAATTGDRPVLLVVDSDADGVTTERSDPLDLTRPLASVSFDGAVGRLLDVDDVGGALASATDRGIAALVMDQVGGAQACLDMSVAYAKDRHQFGRPIGSFQAIKHMCADMLVAVESAKSAAYHLAWAIDHDPDEVPVAAPLAKSYVSEAYFSCAADTIQIHGGIGFTWEHDAHLYFKRAKSSELLFGGPAHHRAVLADRLSL